MYPSMQQSICCWASLGRRKRYTVIALEALYPLGFPSKLCFFSRAPPWPSRACSVRECFRLGQGPASHLLQSPVSH